VGKSAIAGLISAAVAVAAFGLHAPAASAALPDSSLILRYEFETADISGATVTDLSSKHLNGTIANFANATTVAGRTSGTTALSLPGGSSSSTTAPYITVPNGLFNGLSAVTVSSWVKWDGGADFQWLYNLGKNQDSTMFLTPSFSGDAKTRSSIKPVNGNAEVGVSGAGKLPTDQWVNVVTVADGSTISYYLNGVKLGSVAASLNLATAMYSASNTTSGYIGKPFWNGHPFFSGDIDDFRVYSIALTDAQVEELAGSAVPQFVGLEQTDFDLVTKPGEAPVLPPTAIGNYTDGTPRPLAITWNAVPSSAYAAEGVFTVDGIVNDADDAPVTATVTVRVDTISIDLGESTGPFHGGASGTLYGLYTEGLPTSNLIEGINLRTVATKAQDGPQHPGADALEIVKTLADSSDGDVYIYMTDIYRGFPYEWPGSTPQAKLADYMTKMAKQVDQVLELDPKYQDNIVFVPFNEPEGNMFGNGAWSYNGVSWLDNPSAFFAAWDDAYRMIKSKMPAARIAGPNTSILFDQVKGFLEHTVAEDTVPDVTSWHELSAPASIRSNVAKYRDWENMVFAGTDYEGTHLPININEYAFNYHTSVPGQMIQWVSALEDMKVDGDIAYWNIDGNLSDSAVEANRGNGQWWLLNAYGQMTGHTVAVTPPNPGQSYTLQGVATYDPAKTQARAIFGGGSGEARAEFTDVPVSFGSSVHALVQEIGWTGQVGDSAEPATIAEMDIPVVNGTASLTFGDELPTMSEESAYQVILSPGAPGTASTASARNLWQKTYEAEDATYTGSGYSKNGPEGSPGDVGKFYTSGGYNVGGLRTGSDGVLSFTVNVPQDGTYDLSVFANSLNTYSLVDEQGPTNVFLRVDGSAEQELFLPLGYKWVVWDHADTTVRLTAGTHTIALAARNLDGSKSTKGDAIVDKIDLTLANPAAATSIYEAENATLSGASIVTDGDASGSAAVEITNGETAAFWVYSATDATSTVTVDARAGGTANLTVNGTSVTSGLTGTTSAKVFLSGGINKVVLTGAAGTFVVDRVTTHAVSQPAAIPSYEAEAATLAGTAAVNTFTLASGGKAVTAVGGNPGNANTLSFNNVSAEKAGTYAVTVRYSNEEQSPATHYNPDPLARHAEVSVNGAASQRVWFPHSFHENNFWDLTFLVQLHAGTNTIAFSSEELPGFDGETYISDTDPDVLLRSKFAPNIDKISVAPFVEPAPEVTATASSSSPATDGWFRSAATVTLALNTGVSGSIQYRINGTGEWLSYSGALTISGEGSHTVSYRAVADGEPVTGSVGSLGLKIDGTAPTVVASVGSRVVTLTSNDAGSGVRQVDYSLNGGAWTAYSAPVAVGQSGTTVTYRATDVAGNVSTTDTITVPEVGVDSVTNVSAPTISGKGALGATLSASTGTWSPTQALTFSYRWFSDGSVIAGATSASYKVPNSALGKDIAVQVTAQKGTATATATSTSVHVRAVSITTVKLKDSTITSATSGKVVVKVKASGAGRETGTVVVHYGSKKKTVTLKSAHKGSITVTLPRLKKGSYKVWAEYKGNADVEGDSSPKTTLKVRAR